jgi:hypothetical protein
MKFYSTAKRHFEMLRLSCTLAIAVCSAGFLLSNGAYAQSLNGIGDPQQQQELQSLQYMDPGSSNFVNVPATLYVLNGSTVKFQVQCDSDVNPNQLSFSWGGLASGTSTTISVQFNQLSQSTSDPFQVTVTANGQTLSANVIVYDFAIQASPDTDFSGRSYDDFGVGEDVTVSTSFSPSDLTASTVGGFVLASSSDLSVSNNGDGTATFSIPETDANTDYQTSFILGSGPSKKSWTYESYSWTCSFRH